MEHDEQRTFDKDAAADSLLHCTTLHHALRGAIQPDPSSPRDTEGPLSIDSETPYECLSLLVQTSNRLREDRLRLVLPSQSTKQGPTCHVP